MVGCFFLHLQERDTVTIGQRQKKREGEKERKKEREGGREGERDREGGRERERERATS